eukprot:COSAG01_NODE_1585_length_9810_cov_8.980435_6_plen_61_part_00
MGRLQLEVWQPAVTEIHLCIPPPPGVGRGGATACYWVAVVSVNRQRQRFEHPPRLNNWPF